MRRYLQMAARFWAGEVRLRLAESQSKPAGSIPSGNTRPQSRPGPPYCPDHTATAPACPVSTVNIAVATPSTKISGIAIRESITAPAT